MAAAMVRGDPVDPGPTPPDLLDKQWSLLAPIIMDATPPGTT